MIKKILKPFTQPSLSLVGGVLTGTIINLASGIPVIPVIINGIIVYMLLFYIFNALEW